jgi:NADH-quinone oxidoreductase subunit H
MLSFLEHPATIDLAKILFVGMFFPFMLTPLGVILERRISAWMQGRVGPNRVGPVGVLQPLADVVKLIFKEDIVPRTADRALFIAGPLLVLVPPALGLIVVPFGSRIGAERLQVADLGIGILWTMAVLSVGVYGIAFGGWASNNKFSLLGGLRASAQLISYELALGLSIIAVMMFASSADPQVIVRRQVEQGWNLWGGGRIFQGEGLLLIPFGLLTSLLFFVSALAENNRLPFDLPECEAELVGGYHTEYSAMKFSMFMMGEYVGMILMSCLLATFFLGGWSLPPVAGPLRDANAWLDSGTWIAGACSVAVFVSKVLGIIVLYIALRWTLPRFKYNQLMDLGWKRLVPLALLNVAAVAVIGVLAGGAK